MWFMWTTKGCVVDSVIYQWIPIRWHLSLPLLRDVRSDVPCIEKSRHTSGSLALTRTLTRSLSHTRASVHLSHPAPGRRRRTGWAHWAEEFPVTFVNDAAPFRAPSRRRRRRGAEGAAEQSPAQASLPSDHNVRVCPRLTHSLGIIAYRQGVDGGSWRR